MEDTDRSSLASKYTGEKSNEDDKQYTVKMEVKKAFPLSEFK